MVDIGRFYRAGIAVEIKCWSYGVERCSHSFGSSSPFRTTLTADLATHSHRPAQSAICHYLPLSPTKICSGEGAMDGISSHGFMMGYVDAGIVRKNEMRQGSE